MKQLDFEINVETTGVEASIQRFQQLRTEIKGVAADSEEFRKLKTEMDDIQDSLKAAGVGAGNFADILGEVPGPIGDIGSTASRTINTLKGLSSIKFSDIKKSIGDLKDDFVAIARNIGNLTGITKVYAVTNAALAKSFVAIGIGETAAAAGAKAFSAALVSTGIGALVVALGYGISKLIDFVKASGDFKDNNKEIAKELITIDSDLVKITENRKKLTEEYLDAAKKPLEEFKSTTVQIQENLSIKGKKEKEMDDTRRALDKYQDKVIELKDALNQLNSDAQGTNWWRELIDPTSSLAGLTEDQQTKILELREALDLYKKTYDEYGEKTKEVGALLTKDTELVLKKIKEDREKAYQDEKRSIETRYNFLINQRKLEGQTFADLEIKENEALIKLEEKYEKDSYALTESLKDKKVDLKIKEKEELERIKKEYDDALILTESDQMNAEILAVKTKYDALIEEAKKFNLSIQELTEASLFQQKKIKEKYRKEEEEREEEKRQLEIEKARSEKDQELQDTYDILNSVSETYEDKIELIESWEERIRKTAYETESERNKDLEELSKIRLSLFMSELEEKAKIEAAYVDIAAKAGQVISDIAWFVAGSKGEASKAYKSMASAAVVVETAASIMGIISSTEEANAKARAMSIATVGEPWVTLNTISGVLSVASVLGQSAQSLKEINSVQIEAPAPPSGSSSSSSSSAGSKFGSGGLLTGNLHGAGGIMTPMGELEGGEFVINRASTRSFLPLLEKINSMGAGQTIPQGNVSSSYENRSMNSSPIIKTYVVASEMTSEQEKQKRIKNLAKL